MIQFSIPAITLRRLSAVVVRVVWSVLSVISRPLNGWALTLLTVLVRTPILSFRLWASCDSTGLAVRLLTNAIRTIVRVGFRGWLVSTCFVIKLGRVMAATLVRKDWAIGRWGLEKM